MSTEDRENRFQRLLLPPDAAAVDKRRRGYQFEELLESMLSQEELEPRLRVRPSGEEIDGSFYFAYRTFLLEAKWHTPPMSASSIYAFKGKVDGKLSGTIGVFISMSGYTEEAVDALTTGKGLNIVLFDRSDIEASLRHGFVRILQAKLRAAAEEGVVFYPFESTALSAAKGRVTADSHKPMDAIALASGKGQVALLCEGQSDRQILTRLGQRILQVHALSADLRVIAAQGKAGIPRIANAIYPLLPEDSHLIIVVDGDGDPPATERAISDQIEVPFRLIVVDPEIEAWLVPKTPSPKEQLKRSARDEGETLAKYIDRVIDEVDLDEMGINAPSFRRFHKLVLKLLKTGRTAGNA